MFGGSFDPPHLGHLGIVDDACERFQLDQLYYVPTAQSLLKTSSPIASSEHRLTMLRMLVAHNPMLALSSWEIDQKPPVSTIETLRHFKSQIPGQYYILIGGDQASQFHKWQKWDEILEEAQVVCYTRAKSAFASQIDRRIIQVDYDDPLSSSLVRDKLRGGESVVGYVSPAIEKYIAEQQLYI